MELYMNITLTETDFNFTERYGDILALTLSTDGRSALWFFGSAVSTIFDKALLVHQLNVYNVGRNPILSRYSRPHQMLERDE